MPKLTNKQEQGSEKPKPRKSAYLAQYNTNEIKNLLDKYDTAQRIELSDHLLKMFGEIADYYLSQNAEVYDNYRTRENELSKKYGKTFQPFKDCQFYQLFEFTGLLIEKGYYTTEEFNALQDQENQLSETDIKQWTGTMKRYLEEQLNFYYLQEESEIETAKSREPDGAKEEPDKEMTQARQLLAIYYLLKAGLDIEPHKSHNVTEIARFAHLLLGVKYTNPQNSNIYKKYKKLPDFNSGSHLIKDLRYIRPYFEALDIRKAIELIDAQLESTFNELPAIEKKKYKE